MSEPPLAYPDLDRAPIDAGPGTDAGPARPRRRQLALYVLAYGGTWIAVQAPLLVSLPLRVEQIAPDHSAQALSLVLGLGGVVALGSPLYGRLSDRTLARSGRRAAWLGGGSLPGLLRARGLAAGAPPP